jgi:hypothetical protein
MRMSTRGTTEHPEPRARLAFVPARPVPRAGLLAAAVAGSVLAPYMLANSGDAIPAPVAPVDHVLAAEAPAVKAPAVKAPAVKDPVARVPAVKVPAVKAPAVKVPAVKTPAMKSPAMKAPVARVPAVKVRAVKVPVVKMRAVKVPAVASIQSVSGPTSWKALNSAIARIPNYRRGVVTAWIVGNPYGHLGTTNLRTRQIYMSRVVPPSRLYSVVAHEYAHALSVVNYAGELGRLDAGLAKHFRAGKKLNREYVADCMARQLGASWTYYIGCSDRRWRAAATTMLRGRRL